MYIVVGLGNPGRRYAKTRHNMGFRAIDKLAADHSIKVGASRFNSLIGEGMISGEKVILVKPQTFMNLSGEAVIQVFNYYKLPEEHLIVVYDDLDLPLGSLRIRKSGGPGTHNGMRSVVSLLGFTGFPRVRLGIGNRKIDEDIVDHVIGKVPKDEQALLNELVNEGARAVKDIIEFGVEKAMNFNNIRRETFNDN